MVVGGVVVIRIGGLIVGVVGVVVGLARLLQQLGEHRREQRQRRQLVQVHCHEVKRNRHVVGERAGRERRNFRVALREVRQNQVLRARVERHLQRLRRGGVTLLQRVGLHAVLERRLVNQHRHAGRRARQRGARRRVAAERQAPLRVPQHNAVRVANVVHRHRDQRRDAAQRRDLHVPLAQRHAAAQRVARQKVDRLGNLRQPVVHRARRNDDELGRAGADHGAPRRHHVLEAEVVVRMPMRDPDAAQSAQRVGDGGGRERALQLAERALAAVEKHAALGRHAHENAGDVAALARQRRAGAEKRDRRIVGAQRRLAQQQRRERIGAQLLEQRGDARVPLLLRRRARVGELALLDALRVDQAPERAGLDADALERREQKLAQVRRDAVGLVRGARARRHVGQRGHCGVGVALVGVEDGGRHRAQRALVERRADERRHLRERAGVGVRPAVLHVSGKARAPRRVGRRAVECARRRVQDDDEARGERAVGVVAGGERVRGEQRVEIGGGAHRTDDGDATGDDGRNAVGGRDSGAGGGRADRLAADERRTERAGRNAERLGAHRIELARNVVGVDDKGDGLEVARGGGATARLGAQLGQIDLRHRQQVLTARCEFDTRRSRDGKHGESGRLQNRHRKGIGRGAVLREQQRALRTMQKGARSHQCAGEAARRRNAQARQAGVGHGEQEARQAGHFGPVRRGEQHVREARQSDAVLHGESLRAGAAVHQAARPGVGKEQKRRGAIHFGLTRQYLNKHRQRLLIAMASLESTLSSAADDTSTTSQTSALFVSPIDSVGYAQTGYLIGLVLLLLAVVAPLLVQAIRAKVFSSSSATHQN